MKILLLVNIFFSSLMSLACAGPPKACFKDTCVHLEIVKDEKAMTQGLSGRSTLGVDQGMLFVFSVEGRYAFWMNDMKFALDILWLDHKGQVVYIAKNLPACTKNHCPQIAPSKPAFYVLEVNAGFATAHHLTTGSKLRLFM